MIRVLLCDDHAMVRAGLERLLQATGDIEVVASCASGDEAVRAARELRPDVVLLDMAMPGMDGTSTARAITQADPDVRVLMISTFGETREVQGALEAGAHGYLLKDVEPEVLLAGIRSLRAGGMPLSPAIAARLVGGSRPPVPVTTPSANGSGMPLTPRETEVLRLIVDGHSNKQIASRLGISEKTVKTYCGRMFQRLGVTDRTQAAIWAERNLPRCDA